MTTDEILKVSDEMIAEQRKQLDEAFQRLQNTVESVVEERERREEVIRRLTTALEQADVRLRDIQESNGIRSRAVRAFIAAALAFAKEQK